MADHADRPAAARKGIRIHSRHVVAWLVLLAASGVLGYQVGQDLAERDNRRDCEAAGGAKCG